MKIKNILLIFIILGVVATYIFHKESFLVPYEKTAILMDTVVTIKVYGENKNYLEDVVDKAFENMRKLEILLNNYDSRSDIYKININAGEKPVKVSRVTVRFLQESIDLCKATDGYLDITIGVILNLWGFATEHPHIPEKKELEKALKLKGINYIKIDKKNNEVFIYRKGVAIDVGAVAKGFIIEQTAQFLSSKVTKGVINAGGDIKFIGLKDKNKLWKVGIKNPFVKDENNVIKTISIGDWSVATSGDYERFFIKDGKRYHHIINPFTGYPANKVHSVTVTSDNAFVSDGLATAIFVMGDKLFLSNYYKKFRKRVKHFRVIIIKSKNDITDTENNL